jgi:hypothetical protein
MVISHLDLEDKCKSELYGELTKEGCFIKHLVNWYYRVDTQNVRRKTESYLFYEANILSDVSIIDAIRDAQRCILDISNFYKKVKRDLSINGYLDTKYQSEMMSIMVGSFHRTNSNVCEFGIFFQVITNFLIRP